MAPKIMVVTPAWCTEENQRQDQLLQSIFWMQTQHEKDFVHVVVNDGSTDDTSDVLESLTGSIPSLEVYHKDNGGSSSAVNFGIEQALGTHNPEFITVSHSDDVLPPNSLEDRLAIAKASGADMVYTDVLNFDENSGEAKYVSAVDFDDSGALHLSLLSHKYIPYPTMFWERRFFLDKVGGYDERIVSAEDWDIAIRSADEMRKKGGKHHAVLPKITAAYRVHDNNLGKSNFRDGTKWRCYKMILDKHFKGNRRQRQRIIESYRMFRMWAPQYLPEKLKVHLRVIRDKLLNRPPQVLPYRSEFIEKVRDIDYQGILVG